MERAALDRTKSNAEAEVELRSRQAAKRSGLLQAGIQVKESEDSATNIGLMPVPSTKPPAFEMDVDGYLQPRILQLHGHLKSIETNATQTKGMNASISDTAAILQNQTLIS
ncbi:hypothetical protein MMC26_003806 [Xylographa opegraphella]|nr:hypothetical protein [Xylographa opegraphella]